MDCKLKTFGILLVLLLEGCSAYDIQPPLNKTTKLMVIGGGLLKPGGDISNAEILKDVEKLDLESGNACIKPPDLPEKLMWFTAQSMPVFGFVETKNKINE